MWADCAPERCGGEIGPEMKKTNRQNRGFLLGKLLNVVNYEVGRACRPRRHRQATQNIDFLVAKHFGDAECRRVYG